MKIDEEEYDIHFIDIDHPKRRTTWCGIVEEHDGEFAWTDKGTRVTCEDCRSAMRGFSTDLHIMKINKP